MTHRRIVARPPRSQRSRRPRRRGRLSPTNGSVTRADIEAIYREFTAEPVTPPPTVAEFVEHLLGAITDWTPGPHQRARMSARQRARRARERQQAQGPRQLAQPPSEARAAA